MSGFYQAVATWVPSVSLDVVFQQLEWVVNGEVVLSVHLPPDAKSRSTAQDKVLIEEGDAVCARISPNDGRQFGESVEVCATVPLIPPEPVTGLALEIEFVDTGV